MYSLFYGLGGKGIATGFGILLLLHPPIACFTIITWSLTATLMANIGLASVAACGVSIVSVIFSSTPLMISYIAIALFSIYRHKSNINQWLTEMTKAT